MVALLGAHRTCASTPIHRDPIATTTIASTIIRAIVRARARRPIPPRAAAVVVVVVVVVVVEFARPAATFEFDPASARLAAPRRDRASRVARASPRAPRRVRVRVRIVVGVARARLTRAAVRPHRRRTVDSLPENLWI
tara:strand:+ start:186 stop:599 length:414 start_codon:yes stop_codon:yes gene_type:complete